MIVMRHEFVVDYPDRKEYISSTLLDYGIPNGIPSIYLCLSIDLSPYPICQILIQDTPRRRFVNE